MSKNRKVTTSADTFTMPQSFPSVSVIGYQAARYVDQSSVLIRALIDANIDWPNGISEENLALLKSGIVLRKAEITPPTWFRVEGKNLVKLDETPTAAMLKAEPGCFLKLDVPYATGITPHNLGGMKETHPAEYEEVVKLRKAVSQYVSNVIGRLKSMTKALTDPEGRTRGKTVSIKERLDVRSDYSAFWKAE
jgi:hypothetical protein